MSGFVTDVSATDVRGDEPHSSVQQESFLLPCLWFAEHSRSVPGTLEYFDALRSLEAEGRYETVLIQLHQLDKLNPCVKT